MDELIVYIQDMSGLTLRALVQSKTGDEGLRERKLGFLDMLGQVAPPDVIMGDENIVLDRVIASLLPLEHYSVSKSVPVRRTVIVPFHPEDTYANDQCQAFWRASMGASLFLDQYTRSNGGWMHNESREFYGGFLGPFALVRSMDL